MKQYFRLPLKWNTITTYFSSSHLAIDEGWNSAKGGKNVPIYSASDGVVFDNFYNDETGYAVWVKYQDDSNTWLFRYIHMNKKSTLKVGVKIKRGDLIGYMGTTGTSTGNHLHFDVWKCPKNYAFNWNDRKKYAVNPTDYVFLFEDQSTGESNKGITKVVGTSKQAKRDTTKNQLEIVGSLLRVRKGAGTNQTILGYIDYGIYDYTETKEANGYTWYNVGFGWVAYLKDDVKIYKKEEQSIEPEELENDINDLIAELGRLDTELEEQKQIIEQQKVEIDKLTEELSNCQNSNEFVANLKEFVANETGTYYIKLEKGEKLYKN